MALAQHQVSVGLEIYQKVKEGRNKCQTGRKAKCHLQLRTFQILQRKQRKIFLNIQSRFRVH